MAKKKTPPTGDDAADYTEVTSEEVPQTGMVVSHRHALAAVQHFDAADGFATEAEAQAAAGPEPQKVYDIQKVKVKDNKLYTEYIEIHQGDGLEPRRFEITRNGGPQVHPDLKAQLHRLIPFLAHSCNQVTDRQPVDVAESGEELPVVYLDYDVTGISVGENGVTIVGSRTIWGNRKLNLVSNFIDYGDENRDPWYPYAEDVAGIVLDVLAEACLAIDGKSWQPQLDLFDKKAA
jgi:hypothetical protein